MSVQMCCKFTPVPECGSGLNLSRCTYKYIELSQNWLGLKVRGESCQAGIAKVVEPERRKSLMIGLMTSADCTVCTEHSV